MMLITVLFCTFGMAFAGDGYDYPKPSKPFPDPCPPGFTGTFPDCRKPADEPKCPEGSTGEYPSCGYLPPATTSGKCDLSWEEFKTSFEKTYSDELEEQYRHQIYLQNQQIILAHNALYEQGLETYSMCVNKFGDWLHTEYLNINGLDLSKAEAEVPEESDDESLESHSSHDSHFSHGSPSPHENEIDDAQEKGLENVSKVQGGTRGDGEETKVTGKLATKSANNGKSPASKDWRNEGAVTPVKDQLKCASCWAFSAVGALEGQFFLKDGILNSLSEQQLVDCSRRLGNNGCNTGFMTNAFLYTTQDGIVTEEAYPYEARDNKCRVSQTSMKNQLFKTIPKGNEEKLKEAVGNIGPVSVGLDGTHQQFQFYSEGVYFNKACNPDNISHAVLAIGYDVDESTGMEYWIIKNSYGTTWGQGGYGKIARNKNNHCGITNLASYPIVH